MDDEIKGKKKRSPNFSTPEVNLLCSLVVKHAGIIENKKSDALAWQEKLDCWKQLTSEFNGENDGPPRTVTTLRGKYETFKKDLRKKAAKYKQELYKTGGGVLEVPHLTPNEQKIYDISLSVSGLLGRFDDDGEIETRIASGDSDDEAKQKNEVATENSQEVIVIEVNDDVFDGDINKNVNQISEEQKNTWKDWTPKSLKAPKSKSLQVNRNTQLLTKFQASQKVNSLAEAKKELIQLQIKYLKKKMEHEEPLNILKLKIAEDELKQSKCDVEIKEIEKKIKEETLKKILQKNYNFDL